MFKNVFLFLLFLFFISPITVHASDSNFKTDLTIYYTIDATGSSRIKELYAVTNLTSRYLISNYEYQITGDVPPNLIGRDQRGPLTLQTQKLDSGQTLIRVIFNEVVAGKNQVLYFSLTHDGPKAQFSDNVWKVTFPKISNPKNIDSYTLKVITPKEFGQLAYSLSNPDSSNPEVDKKNNTYSFSKDKSILDGLSAVYGHFQISKFLLTYKTTEQNNTISTIRINLPTQLDKQKVYIKSINPPPTNVILDDFGRWIAEFKKDSSNKQFQILVSGQVQLSPEYATILYNLPGAPNIPEDLLPVKTEISPDIFVEPKTQIDISLIYPFQIVPFIKTQGFIKIKNIGIAKLNSLPLESDTHGFSVNINDFQVGSILPGGYLKIPMYMSISISDLLSTKYLTVTVGSDSVTYNIPSYLFYINYVFITIIFTVTFLGAAAYAHSSWGLYIQRRGQKGNIHR